MVNVGKLWGNARFASLPLNCKTLYIYLVTQPSITTLGVLELDRSRVILDTGIKDKEYGLCARTLRDKGYLVWASEEENFDTFIIKEHFLSLSKSKLNIRKAIDEGKSSIYRQDLLKIYKSSDFETSMSFVPPTPEEVTEYAMSKGYIVNGKTFVDYYASNDWYNKNNKKLRSWKLTLEKVWCREENKLEAVPGAPKGFEYFYAITEDGDRIYPSGWKDGMPTSGNYLHSEILRDEYNEITKG